ncbi:MAG TPA: Wzt carbohydrate-binding domain-containing protein [Bryobacteraceae bacterium]|nr:Wzt carbohydrate-binding domain-containing protein [Bryobacteraceae bacterium]
MPVDVHPVPGGGIIGLIGEQGSGIPELLKLAAGQPDVIALDHTLAAQDAVARVRTLIELNARRRQGATILLASHELALLESVCDEVWWLSAGALVHKGDPKETIAKYRRHVAEKVRSWGAGAAPELAPAFRRGDGRAELISVETLGSDGLPSMVWKSGENVSVRAAIRFHQPVSQPVIGLMIRTQVGLEVYGTNTELEGVRLGPCSPGEVWNVAFSFRCDLCPRPYTLTLASHDADGTAHDWLDDAVAIAVIDDRYTAGVANLRATVTAERSG